MKEEIKVVIDTNVFVSALIGKSQTLLRLYNAFIDSEFTPILSLPLYLELLEVINRPEVNRYFRPGEAERLKELLSIDTIFVVPTHEINVCPDPEDNLILECALEGADFIVTGDKALLDLKSFHHIPILTPKEFLSRLKK